MRGVRPPLPPPYTSFRGRDRPKKSDTPVVVFVAACAGSMELCDMRYMPSPLPRTQSTALLNHRNALPQFQFVN
jgi:hypothetical protein